MDIELLRTFLEVARTRHFGKAASELYVTQSAVSARIRQLEQIIGMPLFIRNRNNIQLTAEGRQLRKHAETIVQVWARARRETGMSADFTNGLAIGAMVDLWETLLCDWLLRLRLHMPDTALQIEAGPADVLIRKLLDNVIDLAVLFEHATRPDGRGGQRIRLCHGRLGHILFAQSCASLPGHAHTCGAYESRHPGALLSGQERWRCLPS
jgi:DNA-binding transcriptional LysR family regulator